MVTPGWCNGNTDASGALILGSNPSPGKFKPAFRAGFKFLVSNPQNYGSLG